jgi:DNA-binding GntR family transcriptional regulator
VTIRSDRSRSFRAPMVSTKSAWAYNEVRRMVLEGELQPGGTVSQVELARQLQLSITPLREALGRLETEGFLSLNAHRTMTINPLSTKELDDLYRLRILLDPYAVGLATKRMTQEEVASLGKMAEHDEGGGPVTVMALNREFHRAIYSNSGNILLTRILDQLWSATDRYRLALLARDGSGLTTAVREHVRIAEAIGACDARTAERLMREHVEATLTQLKAILVDSHP